MTKTELNNQHLDWLEAESIHIIRELVAECENPALLFSGGKDSVVLLALARKAFQLGDRPVKLPFPLVHIDTGHNYPEVIAFRDEFGQWDPKAQRPELWSLYNAKLHKGENMRVFPISNWTELDIWQYIARENLELPSIYYSHKREVVNRKGLLVPVTPLTPKLPNEVSEVRDVRFRTVGDISCTCPVASTASTPLEIIEETVIADISERSATRLDDQASEAAMEKRKKEGYF
ncbi:sulfate adenylyltransferase subunit CysD [Haemophilus parahaemolyticus]|uniref:sulfate adenylyltransferase subunit CysD n=1 Tax=Haemophilus parahaemolyticus TaxID=735 RepID=UPI002492573A|nr:sulfate adenylyltransferase subunit CysD [Haemophilus parahaemolyticus]